MLVRLRICFSLKRRKKTTDLQSIAESTLNTSKIDVPKSQKNDPTTKDPTETLFWVLGSFLLFSKLSKFQRLEDLDYALNWRPVQFAFPVVGTDVAWRFAWQLVNKVRYFFH